MQATTRASREARIGAVTNQLAVWARRFSSYFARPGVPYTVSQRPYFGSQR